MQTALSFARDSGVTIAYIRIRTKKCSFNIHSFKNKSLSSGVLSYLTKLRGKAKIDYVLSPNDVKSMYKIFKLKIFPGFNSVVVDGVVGKYRTSTEAELALENLREELNYE